MNRVKKFLLYDFIDAMSSDKGAAIQFFIAISILSIYVIKWVIG